MEGRPSESADEVGASDESGAQKTKWIRNKCLRWTAGGQVDTRESVGKGNHPLRLGFQRYFATIHLHFEFWKSFITCQFHLQKRC